MDLKLFLTTRVGPIVKEQCRTNPKPRADCRKTLLLCGCGIEVDVGKGDASATRQLKSPEEKPINDLCSRKCRKVLSDLDQTVHVVPRFSTLSIRCFSGLLRFPMLTLPAQGKGFHQSA